MSVFQCRKVLPKFSSAYKCQVFAHIAKCSEKSSLIFSCTLGNVISLCFSITQRIFWSVRSFLANTLSPLLGWRLKDRNNQAPVQVKQSEGEKVVQPLCCCLASWRVYYSMFLCVNLARYFSLSLSCISVHFHFQPVRKGLPFIHFLGDNGLEGTESAGSAGTIYLLWRGSALLRGRRRFCWVSTLRTSWSPICLHAEVLCWIIAQGSQLPALRFLIKNKTSFLEAAHVLWAVSSKVPLLSWLFLCACLTKLHPLL